MKTHRNLLLLTAGLAVASSLVAPAAEHRIDLDPASLDGRLIIANAMGDVVINGTDEKGIVIVTDRDEPAGKKRPAPEGLRSLFSSGGTETGQGFEIKRDGRTVTLVPTRPHEMGDLVVSVPRSMSVRLAGVVRGDVQVRRVSGEIELVVTEGDVVVEHAAAPVVVHAVNGDVSVAYASFPREAPSSINAVNGSVVVTLPAGAAASLDLQTINGDIFTDLPVEVTVRSTPVWGGPRTIKGTVNGGGATLRINCINEDIVLRTAGAPAAKQDVE